MSSAQSAKKSKLKLVLVGEGLALARAIERLSQNGHLVVGIVACSAAVGHALSRLASINYHNAPLPAYAGLRATVRRIGA